MGPAFIDYISFYLRVRFKDYTIVPLFEKGYDPSFCPAEAIFSPFGFSVRELFDEEENSKEGGGKTILKLRETVSKMPKRILFSACLFDFEMFRKAVQITRGLGVSKIHGFFLTKKEK